MKKIKILLSKIKWSKVLLVFSLLIIISLVSFYLLKIDPYIKSLQNELAATQSNLQTDKNNKPGCQKVYSMSQKKVITECPTRETVIADCSKRFSEIFSDAYSKYPNETLGIDKLDKYREFFMKLCMEGKGFEY